MADNTLCDLHQNISLLFVDVSKRTLTSAFLSSASLGVNCRFVFFIRALKATNLLTNLFVYIDFRPYIYFTELSDVIFGLFMPICLKNPVNINQSRTLTNGRRTKAIKIKGGAVVEFFKQVNKSSRTQMLYFREK